MSKCQTNNVGSLLVLEQQSDLPRNKLLRVWTSGPTTLYQEWSRGRRRHNNCENQQLGFGLIVVSGNWATYPTWWKIDH